MAAKSGLEEQGGKKFGQNRAAAGPCGWACCGLRNAGQVGSSLSSDNCGDHIMMDLLVSRPEHDSAPRAIRRSAEARRPSGPSLEARAI